MHFLKGPSSFFVAHERRVRIMMVPARPRSEPVTATRKVGPILMLELSTEAQWARRGVGER